MKQLTPAREYAVYTAIIGSVIAVFAGDLFTPLGIADWMLYMVPLILSLFLSRSSTPLILAVLTTLLLTAGLFLSPTGASRTVGAMNRGFAAFTIWIVAYVITTAIKNRVSLAKQEWIQAGQTKLSEKMAGEQSLESLADNVLRFLSEYMGASSALFYVEESDVFHLKAHYALPEKSGIPEQIKLGEGLGGQAAKDKHVMTLHNLPETYLSVGSALGRTKPVEILAAPAVVDGSAVALLEFSFCKPLGRREILLMERLSEPIAVAVCSAAYRARLQELLDERQRQTEELHAQAEELRVTNEGLEEQTRALQESQTRLEIQQQELEQTNTQLKEQAQMLEVQKANLLHSKTELQRQAVELERANQYKTEFLANMSHELRTPLNSSLILAKLLADNREGNLTPDQVRYAETIEAAGNDLLSLITEILDLSKIEAGRMELRIEWVPVVRTLENLNRIFQPLSSEKKLRFRVHKAPGAPERLLTDPQRLEQILKNLLSNAFKFTEKGEVSLEAQPGANQDELRFIVKDTGIGIAPAQQEVIFEPFRQANGSTNRRYGGTGLGLSISRELARLLGGKLELSSAESQGSTFTLRMPVTLATPTEAQSKEPPEPPGRAGVPGLEAQEPKPESPARKPGPCLGFPDDREKLNQNSRCVLIVEDDPAFARILYDLAHELGFQCLVATTAEEGITSAMQFKPNAVLLDVGLPDNSGLSVLDRLKADSRTRHIPVHVVSGMDQARTALALGAVGYMLKPVSRGDLMQAFERLETKLSQRVRRVLIVEDDAVQLESLQHLLKSRDVETIGVRTAADCLKVLETTTVDCMVLDLNLPDASGLSLLKTLTEQDTYAFPPVIIYTGKDLSVEQEETLRRYSKSIIIKGAKSPERLLDEVTLFLHQVVSDLPVEKQRMLAAAQSRDSALEGKRILVTEDDVRNVFALTSILEPRGAKVDIARNGREALEALERSTREGAPIQLVLMDIMMPEMDGLTAIQEIRKKPEWKKLPIIALTAKAMKADQDNCLQAGANDYMAKPLEVDKLLSLVRVWMPR